MPSPFPGMNPYLERAGVWEMFHTQFLSAMQQHLAVQVEPKYIVMLETRVYVHEPPAAQRWIGGPDLEISRSTPGTPVTGSSGIAAAPAYGTIASWFEIEKSRYLEIHDREGGQVVTVVELLSPSNKYAGPDREQYIVKRNRVLMSSANLVELDLLRGGPRMPTDGLPSGEYYALVSRTDERPWVGIWAWRLRDHLPSIPLPLGSGDPDAHIDLKAILDQIYNAGRYVYSIYRRLPEPRLSAEDAAWAAGFVPAPT